MSSAPKLSHLEKGGQLVHVSLMMSRRSLRFAPHKREETRVTGCKLSKEHQCIKIEMLTNWLCLQEWELAGCISVLEELKKGKGGKEALHF